MTFPIDFPDIPIAKARFGLIFNQGIFPGEFSRKVSIHYHAGGKTDRWQGTITTPILDQEKANALRAFVSSLQGRLGTFMLCDPDHKNPQAYSPGDFLVDTTLTRADSDLHTADTGPSLTLGFVKGSGQGGHSLLTDGWPANVNVFNQGDRLQIGNQYFVLTEEASSDGTGTATLEFEPAIRSGFPDNEPIIFLAPRMVVRLQTPVLFFSSGAKNINPVTLAFEEAL